MSRHLASRGPATSEIDIRHAALLVLDVDEVILEFIEPFQALLEENGAQLQPESFRLAGNVRALSTGEALTNDALARLTERLYAEQISRQRPVPGVEAALSRLGQRADIVFLTAMTPSYYPVRRRLLDRYGLRYPMIATEVDKGRVVADLLDRRRGPVVFVDDLPPNLEAVAKSAPAARLVHLMANAVFREHLPPLPVGTYAAANWPDATSIIEALLDTKNR